MKTEVIAAAAQIGNIWISPHGRPFWTTHNKKGNAGPGLTNKELRKHGLIKFKKYKFDELWSESNKGRKRTWWEKFVDGYFYWI